MKLYVMSPTEYRIFVEACQAPMMLVAEGGEVRQLDRFAKSESFWRAMGTLHGFVWDSARPLEGGHIAYFEAQPTDEPNQFAGYGDYRKVLV